MLTFRKAGYTLPELTVGLGIGALLSVALVSLNFTANRLVAKNLSVNHSNATVREANLRMCRDLHKSYSDYTLVDFTAEFTTSDLTPAASTDTDPLTNTAISNRACGVRYWAVVGGPCRLSSNASPTSTSLTFTIPASSEFPNYTPQAGDKVHFPLIDRELDISSGSMAAGVITVSTTQALGYDFSNTGTTITTATFRRSVGYSVYNGQLRFHRKFPGTAGDIALIGETVTSPKPFALLCPGGKPNSQRLRVSLEAYDKATTARRFQAATTSLQTMIMPRISLALQVQDN